MLYAVIIYFYYLIVDLYRYKIHCTTFTYNIIYEAILMSPVNSNDLEVNSFYYFITFKKQY